MDWQSHITIDPNILMGKPTIVGTRLAVEFIILFRIKAPSSSVIAEKVARSIAFRDDWYGHFSVVEDDKIGMREIDPAAMG
jgi:hypothetical protein